MDLSETLRTPHGAAVAAALMTSAYMELPSRNQFQKKRFK